MMRTVNQIQNLMLKFNVYVSKKQTNVSVEELLERVWPVRTELPLIRIGSETRADGGYLVPDDLEGIDRVFSPGVGKKMDFEQHFLDLGVPCEMVDGSVDSPPHPHPLANFKKLWLADSSGEGRISLNDWVDKNAAPSDEMILQMDIEGAEYEVLLAATNSTLSRFRVIVLEIHDLRSTMSRMGLTLFLATLRQLRASHEIVHSHPNNCCIGVKSGNLEWPDVIELTLLRRDRFKHNYGPAELPHPLDQDNTAHRPIVLSRGLNARDH